MNPFKNMMQQAQAMQSQMAAMQEKLDTQMVEGSSGGGMVKVTLTGRHQVTKVTLDPTLCTADEREVLEDLLVAAFKDASHKAEELSKSEMSKIMGGLSLPPGFNLPAF